MAGIRRKKVQRCRMAGMNEHLSKPLEMDKVVSVIAKYRG